MLMLLQTIFGAVALSLSSSSPAVIFRSNFTEPKCPPPGSGVNVRLDVQARTSRTPVPQGTGGAWLGPR